MYDETSLRAAPLTEAVEQSRRLVARTMRAWNLTSGEEPVTAIVAELVANAVTHAATPFELRLLRSDSHQIRVEVRDRDHRLPILRNPHPLSDGGRGMFLVDCYAASWGAEPAPDGGKVVWAEIDVAPHTAVRT